MAKFEEDSQSESSDSALAVLHKFTYYLAAGLKILKTKAGQAVNNQQSV
ncbi:hypothetical protein [Cylindrospermum sp. FACHB-282]|nr:hypothetical protein [Cylindrospermum sp. FACHB-282]MBD2384044.1 hypothetical protein [Cylindrospermum sp. FACHB-282]